MRIAVAQMESGADRDANLAEIRRLAEQGADAGATLLCLPESCLYRGEPCPDMVESDDGPGLRELATIAAQFRIEIVAGGVWTPGSEPGRPYNTLLWFDHSGQVLARYHKTHLFRLTAEQVNEDESRTTTPGDWLATVFRPGWTFGLSICYDLRFPEVYRALAGAGAGVLLVPANFARLTGEWHWEPLLRARAIENLCYVVAPAQTGVAPDGFVSYGHSLVVDPWGVPVAAAGTDPGLLVCELDAQLLARRRAALRSPSDVRPEVYRRPVRRWGAP